MKFDDTSKSYIVSVTVLMASQSETY